MIKSKKAIAAIFRKIADKIEAGTCEVDDRELTEIANKENIPLKIHFSLHTPIDSTRNELIPASKNSVNECFEYLKQYNDIISKNEVTSKIVNYPKLLKQSEMRRKKLNLI